MARYSLCAIAVLIAVLLSCVFATPAGQPGKLAIFSFGSGSPAHTYNTKAMSFNHVVDTFDHETKDAEVLAFVHSHDGSNVFQQKYMAHVFEKAHASVMPHVYHDDAQQMNKMMKDHILQKVGHVSAIKPTNLVDLHSQVMDSKNANKGMLFNGVPESFEVKLSGNHVQDEQHLNDISAISQQLGKKVTFVLVQEPSAQAVAPKETFTAQRALDTTSSSDVTDGIYYSPEGAEYAIYYADTYLYITPDLFTGIITGLFIASVLFIGISCLGSIQGASSFVMKPIALGKEY